MSKAIFVTKARGNQEPFSISKLKRSMFDTGASKEVIDQIISKLQSSVRQGISTAQIHRLAFQHLKLANRIYAARYNLKKAIMRLGPDGFPFERYFAALLEYSGYKTYTNVIVNGKCITHEVDVIAEKADENIHAIIEAKFHAHPGRKTGSKDALYTYGRFLDIKEGWDIKKQAGAKPQSGTLQSWLVTNTEMTDNAKRYCQCTGIKAIAWSYPNKEESLQGMIHTHGLYPITALLTLNQAQKLILLRQNIILCKSLVEQGGSLKELGLNNNQIDQVLAEVNQLCDLG